MSGDYNDWVREQNAHLDEQVAFANRLVAADGIPEVSTVLFGILAKHCSAELDDEQKQAVVQALSSPVAFAGRQAYESGSRYGRVSVRREIARKLGLGEVKEEA